MKKFLLPCVLLLAYGLLPYEMKAPWQKIHQEDLIITGQACGCPCPQARVLKGSLDIPQQMRAENPGIYTSQMNLVGKTPFEPFLYEIAIGQIEITGKIVGVDTVLCSPQNCETAPRFLVESWQLIDYVPQFLTWSQIFQFLYSCSFALLIIYLFFLLLYVAYPEIFTSFRAKKSPRSP